MADAAFDIIVDTTPNLGTLRPGVYQGRDSLDDLRSSLQTQAPDYYTDERLNGMTRNDLVFADRIDTQAVPVIDSSEPANGTHDVAYTPHQYTVSSGSTPITWSVTAGDLPTGMTLSSAGVLSGTPTVADDYEFTVTATNAAGTDDQPTTVTIA